MENKLLYIEEHMSCQNYMTTIETGFKFIEFTEDTELGEDDTYTFKSCDKHILAVGFTEKIIDL